MAEGPGVYAAIEKPAVLKSQLVREENPMNGDLEGFGHVCLHVDLDNLPSFSFSLNKGALLGNTLVTVHVKIDLFGRWIAVVPKHYLLGRSHASLSVLAPPGIVRPETAIHKSRTVEPRTSSVRPAQMAASRRGSVSLFSSKKRRLNGSGAMESRSREAAGIGQSLAVRIQQHFAGVLIVAGIFSGQPETDLTAKNLHDRVAQLPLAGFEMTVKCMCHSE
jgi:hypothetical protein